MSIGFKWELNSKSSLLSDCTKGLVGALSTKLEENEEDNDGARVLDPRSGSSLSTDGNRGSS
ncbi:hypothetical protein SS1G_01893 [Sclerotinia sclerotiorum 1980 UF-70]|uniref:Uncharacterized protein n=1 Tax=Sclerotinia sclerotiorum (strain ATCC 18683 / 1980 / Ss-1) TaxID=665079 RepID=A7E9B3_SCLS1|nr:hypothetical protein SS1G_01893 [Sclerotinia sclerotiorum 1980 UF-70]EDN96965.1 hypothetical protein SS1G_01893 [Sclerotinia sclerotiorum 1980 UF-70]